MPRLFFFGLHNLLWIQVLSTGWLKFIKTFNLWLQFSERSFIIVFRVKNPTICARVVERQTRRFEGSVADNAVRVQIPFLAPIIMNHRSIANAVGFFYFFEKVSTEMICLKQWVEGNFNNIEKMARQKKYFILEKALMIPVSSKKQLTKIKNCHMIIRI